MKQAILVLLGLILSCAPLKEEGGFENNSITAHSISAPPTQSSTPPPANTPEDSKPTDEEDKEGDETDKKEDEKKKTETQGEEFNEGDETEETGPPPITRDLWS